MRRRLSLLALVVATPVMVATSQSEPEPYPAFLAQGQQVGPAFLLDTEHPDAAFELTAELTLPEAARDERLEGRLDLSFWGSFAEGRPDGPLTLRDEADTTIWEVSLDSIPLDSGPQQLTLEGNPFADCVIGIPCVRVWTLQAELESGDQLAIAWEVDAWVDTPEAWVEVDPGEATIEFTIRTLE